MSGRVLSMPLISREPACGEDLERALLELARDAILRALKTLKAGAIDMHVDQAQLSRQLAGLERFPLIQLARSPLVLDEFACLLAQARGFEVRRPDHVVKRRREIRDLERRLLLLLADDVHEQAS